MTEFIEKVKKECAYDGKSKQWQQGFDSLAKEFLAKEKVLLSEKDIIYMWNRIMICYNNGFIF